MPDANNQSVPETRVEGLYVERLYNLGNYENFKVGVRVAIGWGDDPGRVLTSLERILEDFHAKSGVSDWELERAKRTLAKPEAELEELDEYEKKKLADYRDYVRRDEVASERRRKAREALLTLNYTTEHKDHKEKRDDGDDMEF
jgi:hypothetical protein